ncbi:unnamed protein product [Hyaloperonospora brassicae]|uniref:Vesicle transport v-SNARE N-terminal domain-containing protein n=1 Tax=Hyaloperonospora brassicae TaxID=162125 RepID=A0AAV0V096_HYABA|nr:unnamed protein product [Hyaloperonospora brassicae]
MGKSSDHHSNVEEEFSKLELALNQTAGDTSVCLRLLKKQLAEYDHRNGNLFTHSATSYLRSDMRSAKDTAMELKHVAHQISRSPKPSKTELTSARHVMNETSRTMEALTTTARNYDKENGQSKGIKGTIDTMMGGHHDKDKNEKQSLGGHATGDTHSDKTHSGGLFGGEKDGGHHHKGLSSHADQNGAGIMGSTDTVEGLVQKNLRENFSVKALDHQLSAAEKALSPSMMERAKEAIHDVKDKLKGDKTSPSHGSHAHGSAPVGTHLQGGPTHPDHVHGGGPVGTHLQGGAVGSHAHGGGPVGSHLQGGPTHADHLHGGGPVGTHLQGGAVGSHAHGGGPVGSHLQGGPTHADHLHGGGPVGTHLQGGPVHGGQVAGNPVHGSYQPTHPTGHSTAL